MRILRLRNYFLRSLSFLESLRFSLVSGVASVRERRLRSGREGVSLPRLSHFCSAESSPFGLSEVLVGFWGCVGPWAKVAIGAGGCESPTAQ